MEFHEIDTVGKLWIERVATLPSFVASDVGRLIYVIDVDTYYKGAASEWQELARALNDFAGMVMRPLFEYGSTVAIGVNAGRYHHSGTLEQILKWSASFTFTFGSGGSNPSSSNLTASDWHYLYIDDSALSGDILTAARLINSITEPTWSDTKLGWYNGNDRCIAAFRTNSSSQLKEFWHIGDFIRWDIAETVYNANPSTGWSTATLLIPSFSKWAHCTFYQNSGNDGKNVLFYWRESNSAQSGYLIGRHYVDDSGDNQGASLSLLVEPRVVTDLTNKQIDIKSSAGGYQMRVYQNGYYLAHGM